MHTYKSESLPLPQVYGRGFKYANEVIGEIDGEKVPQRRVSATDRNLVARDEAVRMLDKYPAGARYVAVFLNEDFPSKSTCEQYEKLECGDWIQVI